MWKTFRHERCLDLESTGPEFLFHSLFVQHILVDIPDPEINPMQPLSLR